MENPCDKCIVKVNCTQVCPAKENYKALLKQATRHLQMGAARTMKRTHVDHFFKYEKMLQNTEVEILEIEQRKKKIDGNVIPLKSITL